MKKRVLALLLAGTLALGLAACGGDDSGNNGTPSSNPNPATSDTGSGSNQPDNEPAFEGTREIVVGVSADIKTWEPWGAFNLARQNEAPIVYQNLTTDVVDLEKNEMVHCFVLAESAEPIDDVTYRIKLREGIVDTAGNPFTADDAIFSFNKCNEVSNLTQAKIIANMEKVDELTFDMTLKYNTVGTFYDVCNAINMVTEESYNASPDGMVSQPVGTTPMVLKSYTPNGQVIFEKAGSYWNEKANETKSLDDGYCSMWDFGDLDVIRFDCITDANTMAIALENGTIDIARAIGYDDVNRYESDSNFVVFTAPDAGMGVAFNASSNSPLENYNLRMAIALAINSENALIIAADGNGSVAKAWSYPTFVDYQKSWDGRDYFEYDLNAAKEYLAKWESETGKKAADLSLKVIFQSEDVAEAMALSIQSDIGQLTGNPNTITFEALDRATFTQAAKDATQFDIRIVDSQLVTRSHSGFEWDSLVNMDKNGFNCFGSVQDAELQSKLMDAILVSSTSDETVSAFQDYIDEQCYMKNVMYVDAFGAAKSWIGNIVHATGAKNALNLGALTYDWNASGK